MCPKIRCDGESEKFSKIFWELNRALIRLFPKKETILNIITLLFELCSSTFTIRRNGLKWCSVICARVATKPVSNLCVCSSFNHMRTTVFSSPKKESIKLITIYPSYPPCPFPFKCMSWKMHVISIHCKCINKIQAFSFMF
jgi:hypothetical protein